MDIGPNTNMMTSNGKEERLACTPLPINPNGFNSHCILPYSLTVKQVQAAMNDFLDFLGFLNQQLHKKGFPRLESFLMPANFSSLVGEFINMTLPKYCLTLVKNQYHNGHPDLIPAGKFPNNAVQYSQAGIEIKSSRHAAGWQGHNPETVWLIVFHFDSNTSIDNNTGVQPKSFCFKGVYAAKLDKSDWTFAGRSASSRRTITASVNQQGVKKMKANWVYKDSN
jgi:hypothetical protein